MRVVVDPCPCGLPVRPHELSYEVERTARFTWTIHMRHGPSRIADPWYGEPSAFTRKRAVRKGERWLRGELRRMGAGTLSFPVEENTR